MSLDDNQTRDHVIISYSGNIYHTAIETWKVEYLFQQMIPNLEELQQINQTKVIG